MTSRWTVLLCVGSWGCGPAVADPPAATATSVPGAAEGPAGTRGDGSTSGAGSATSTLGLHHSLVSLLVLVPLGGAALGCQSSPSEGTSSAGTTGSGTTASTEADGGSTETTGVDTDTDAGTDTGGDDPLQVCLELPEADAAGWIQGEDGDPAATASQADLQAAGAASWGLALRMLQTTPVAASENYAGSPLTMMTSLGLAYARHGDPCEGRLVGTIGLPMEGEEVHNTLAGLLAELTSRTLPADDDPDEPLSALELLVAPSMWSVGESADSIPAAEPYGVAEHSLTGDDFGAMNTVINCVVEQQSQGLLPEFLPSSIPGADTTAVDLMVAYLGAPWATTLTDAGDMDFEAASGTVQVPGLYSEWVSGRVFDDEEALAFSLPLRGGQLSVMFVMPRSTDGSEDGLDAFIQNATPESLAGLRDGMAQSELEVQMPAIDIPATTTDYYEPLGLDCELFTLRTALDAVALTLDATGIRAAAAGAVESWGSGTGSPVEDSVVLDRPYLFFVYDEPTQAVLFHGRFVGG